MGSDSILCINCLFTQILNQPINLQQSSVCRHYRDDLLKFKPSIRKEEDFSDFECDAVVSARWAGWSISKTDDSLGVSYDKKEVAVSWFKMPR